MLVPETEQPKTAGKVVMPEDETEKEVTKIFWVPLRAAPATDLHMALNIGAMLIAFISLIRLLDGIMGGIHNHLGMVSVELSRDCSACCSRPSPG